MIRIFLDTEFTSLNTNAELISLALVTQNGDYFYAIFNDYNPESLSDFTKENVIPFLKIDKNERTDKNGTLINGNKTEICIAIKKWLLKYDEIQLWADVPHYDWVLFCELFGGSLHLPKNVHYMIMDLATLLEVKGYDINASRIDILKERNIHIKGVQHNALYDARVGLEILKSIYP